MEIQTNQEGKVITVSLNGRLDGTTAGKLEAAFGELVENNHRHYIFDFSGLEYISSAGLRVILGAAKKLKVLQGRMVLAGLNENVKEVFEMAGLHTIFEIVPTCHEALEAISTR